MDNQGDQFEVTVWVPVTIWNPQLWLAVQLFRTSISLIRVCWILGMYMTKAAPFICFQLHPEVNCLAVKENWVPCFHKIGFRREINHTSVRSPREQQNTFQLHTVKFKKKNHVVSCLQIILVENKQKDDRVCAQLFCFDAKSGYCVSYRPAAEGSPCGHGQVHNQDSSNNLPPRI